MSKTKDKPLNPKQKLFCKLFASNREFFGNGTESYIEAYNPKRQGNWYASAASSASRLLKNDKILQEIDKLLEEMVLNDSFVDKQLAILITQNADFRSKLGAISEYNKLKARITKKIDHTTKGKKLPTPIYGSKSVNNTE